MNDFVELLRVLANPAKPSLLTDEQVDALIVNPGRPLDDGLPIWPAEK